MNVQDLASERDRIVKIEVKPMKSLVRTLETRNRARDIRLVNIEQKNMKTTV